MRFFPLSVIVCVACARADDQRAVAASDTVHSTVDSIFPVEEDIRRFKAARNGAAATELATASVSRDALVARFIEALESKDTIELRAMVISPAEFIDLYYPISPYAAPPYRQSPELFWFLLQQNSEKGIKRVLDRYSGVPSGFAGYACDAAPLVQGDNRIWTGCIVQWAPTPDAPSPIRLFGAILERGGGFKFVSYANDL